MTKTKLKTKIREAIYAGNIGIHELMVFYKEADPSLINQVDDMFKRDDTDHAWHVVKDFLRSIGKLVSLNSEQKTK